eukprot:gene37149-45829_t
MNNASACGNVAQYYFDGRASGGINYESAREHCLKSIELGCDKHFLMADILFKLTRYIEAVSYLQTILSAPVNADVSAFEYKKRASESEQNYQNFMSNRSASFDSSSNLTPSHTNSPNNRSMSSLAQLLISIPPSTPQGSRTAQTPLSSKQTPMSISTPTNTTRKANNTPLVSASAAAPALLNTLSEHLLEKRLSSVECPGWVHVSEDLEGFDPNVCTDLTAKIQVLHLEYLSIQAAFTTAEKQIAAARDCGMSDEIVKILTARKETEFEAVYRKISIKKDAILSAWEQYVDTDEHTLRRQIIAEKHYFAPLTSTSNTAHFLAKDLLLRRLQTPNSNYNNTSSANLNTGGTLSPRKGLSKAESESREPILLINYNNCSNVMSEQLSAAANALNESNNNPIGTFTPSTSRQKTPTRLSNSFHSPLNGRNLYQHSKSTNNMTTVNSPAASVNGQFNNTSPPVDYIPTSRDLITAERSLLEAAVATYGRGAEGERQKTGWAATRTSEVSSSNISILNGRQSSELNGRSVSPTRAQSPTRFSAGSGAGYNTTSLNSTSA